jgi:hypothetical protein
MPIQTIKNLLNSPSELNLTLRYTSNFAFGLWLFVSALVLILIWPLPEANWFTKLSDAASCGLVAVVVYGINITSLPQVMGSFFDAKRWTIGRDILFVSWLFFLVSTVNMLMLRALGWSNFEWGNFIGQQLFSIFLGIPPVTAMIVLRNRELAKQHLREAVIINQLLLESPKRKLLLNQGTIIIPPTATEPKLNTKTVDEQRTKISLQGEDKELFSIFAEQIAVLQSEKGKLYIYWIDEYAAMQYKELSLSLGNVEKFAAGQPELLTRCHRFFWVNINAVEKAESNARGLQLKIVGIPEPIPVSKTYTDTIKSLLKS